MTEQKIRELMKTVPSTVREYRYDNTILQLLLISWGRGWSSGAAMYEFTWHVKDDGQLVLDGESNGSMGEAFEMSVQYAKRCRDAQKNVDLLAQVEEDQHAYADERYDATNAWMY